MCYAGERTWYENEYTPSFIESGKTINSTAFKKHMDERGWNIIEDASIKIGEDQVGQLAQPENKDAALAIYVGFNNPDVKDALKQFKKTNP